MNSNKWFMQLISPDNNFKISVYNDGLVVFLLNDGKVKFNVSEEIINNIKKLINKDMYIFKSCPNADYGNNNMTIRIRDNSRKHRNISIKGWSQTKLVYTLILKGELIIKKNQLLSTIYSS